MTHSSTVETCKLLTELACPFPTTLTAIHPETGAITTRGFAPQDFRLASRFVETFNGTRGIYFGVNGDRRKPAVVKTKARRADISHALAAHVDIDVYKGMLSGSGEVLAALASPPPGTVPGPPTMILNSGNGIQAFWYFDHPVELDDHQQVARVEGINRSIAELLGGDSTHDVSRVMRVPNTINVPNRAKKALGLKTVRSSLISLHRHLRYNVDAFPIAGPRDAPRVPRELTIDEAEAVDNLDDLLVTDRVKTTIALGGYPGVRRASRSEWLFSVILSLIRAGERDEIILGIITDARWAISACVLDKPDPDHHGRRQITRAHAWLSKKVREDFQDDQF